MPAKGKIFEPIVGFDHAVGIDHAGTDDFRNLPSTRELQAFVYVAELGSLASAANFLSISISAVSQRIHSLQDRLGDPLFMRGRTGLSLTLLGQAYKEEAARVLSLLQTSSARARRALGSTGFSIATNPVIYAGWLLPRLRDFTESFGVDHIELLSLNSHTVERADAVLWPSSNAAARAGRHRLFDFEAAPFCHPDLIARAGLAEPEDLQRITLIDGSPLLKSWPMWFAQFGIQDLNTRRLVVDSFELALECAGAGLGAVITSPFLAERLLQQGLVRQFGGVIKFPGGLEIEVPSQHHKDISHRFFDWISREAAKSSSP